MKRIKCRLIASIIYVGLLMIVANSGAQNSGQAEAQRISLGERYAWAQDEWTGNDQPYTSIRHKIDKAVGDGQKPDDLLAKYAKAAKSDSDNAEAQFAWGYAGWKARKAFTDHKSQYERIGRQKYSLGRVASPRIYEFARLRFLIEAWAAPFAQLEDLGQRLVRRNPNDYDVKYYLVQVLCRVPTPKAKQQALGYVHEFIRAKPKKISYWLNLGAVYNFSWYQSRGKNRTDGKNAIAAYRKYLQLAPTNDKKRKDVFAEIQYIQKRKAMWDKKTTG